MALPQLPLGLTPSNSFVHLPSYMTLSDGRSLKTVGSHGNLIFAMEHDEDGGGALSPVEIVEAGEPRDALGVQMQTMVLVQVSFSPCSLPGDT